MTDDASRFFIASIISIYKIFLIIQPHFSVNRDL